MDNTWIFRQLKRLILYVVNVLLLLVLNSCDPSDITLPAYQADFYLPMMKVELSPANLLLTDSSGIFQEDSTGLLSLNYQASASRTLEEIVKIDDTNQDFTIPGIPGDIPDFALNFPIEPILLGIDTGFYQVFAPAPINYEDNVDIREFVSAHFNSGLITLSIKNDFPFVLEAGLLLELQNVGEDTPFFQFNLDADVQPGESYVFQDQDLANKYLTNSFLVRIVDLTIPVTNDIRIDPDNSLQVDISFQQLSLDKATFEQPNIEIPEFEIDLPLIFEIGSRITEGRLDNGLLSLEIPEIQPVFDIKITLPTVYQNGQPFELSFNGNSTEASLTDLDIELLTKVIDTLAVQDTIYNILPVKIQLAFNQALETFDIEFDKPLDGKISVTDIDYAYLLGYLGRLTDVGKMQVEPEFFDIIRSGSLTFEDPIITIGISNGVGATGQIYDDGQGLYVKGKNERLYGEKEISFGGSLNGFTLPAAQAKGSPGYAEFILDKENEPNFREFLSIFPTVIDVRIPVSVGTSAVAMDQFLYDDDIIGVDLGLELPLSIAADRFVISDTTQFSLDLETEKYEVLRMAVDLRFENYFPLELTFQTIFLDENYVVLDSLFEASQVVASAAIGEDGRVTEPLLEEFRILYERGDISRMQNYAYAVPVIKINTPDGQYAKLFTSEKIRLQMTGELLTNLTLSR